MSILAAGRAARALVAVSIAALVVACAPQDPPVPSSRPAGNPAPQGSSTPTPIISSYALEATPSWLPPGFGRSRGLSPQGVVHARLPV
jgi:hypothetical protein